MTQETIEVSVFDDLSESVLVIPVPTWARKYLALEIDAKENCIELGILMALHLIELDEMEHIKNDILPNPPEEEKKPALLN